jgi:hypothetical protein
MAGRVRSIEKSIDLIGNRACNVPACSVMIQPTILPHAPQTNSALEEVKRAVLHHCVLLAFVENSDSFWLSLK